jgi:hypothetical protein
MPPAVASLARDPLAFTPLPASLPAARSKPQRDEPVDIAHRSDLLTMEAAYRARGGIASGEQVALMLRRCHEQPLSRLARWIVAREVVSFEGAGITWLPLFQFERVSMSVRPEVAAVIGELADVFEDRELAAWFTLPNDWLRGAVPADALAVCPSAVRDAARADRFIVRG